MGRTAAFDNHLDKVCSIPDFPGKVIRESVRCETLIICIHPKSPYSGKAFVRIILDHADVDMNVLSLDCKSYTYILWQGSADQGILSRIKDMGFEEGEPLGAISHISYKDNVITRHLQACSPGDHVLCNNLYIGTATGESVSISVECGKVVSTTCIDIKEHGIEKLHGLGPLDIITAKCCATRELRKDVSSPRVEASQGSGVAFVNHAGAFLYELTASSEGAVVVGDDTSRIVADALYRHAKPVYAITDGDWDMLIGKELFFPGSYLVEVTEDDSAGYDVYKEIFLENTYIDMPFEQLCETITSYLGSRIQNIRSFE